MDETEAPPNLEQEAFYANIEPDENDEDNLDLGIEDDTQDDTNISTADQIIDEALQNLEEDQLRIADKLLAAMSSATITSPTGTTDNKLVVKGNVIKMKNDADATVQPVSIM